MSINLLGQYQPLITAFLPLIAAVLSGIARQDRLAGREPLNEFIALVILVGSAAADAAFNGHITGSPFLDFMFILAYTGVLMHSPLGGWIQQVLQTHLLSVGGKTPVGTQPVMVPTSFASAAPQLEAMLLQALPHLEQLVPLLKQLTIGGFLPQAAPAAPVQASPVAPGPTRSQFAPNPITPPGNTANFLPQQAMFPTPGTAAVPDTMTVIPSSGHAAQNAFDNSGFLKAVPKPVPGSGAQG